MESSRLGDGSRRRNEAMTEPDTRSKRKGKDRGDSSGQEGEEAGKRNGGEGNERKGRARALSPSDIGPPLPQTSLRELKKQAFAKYHAPRQAERGQEGTDGRGRASGRGRGQPNMAARMGVLLERIKRDRMG